MQKNSLVRPSNTMDRELLRVNFLLPSLVVSGGAKVIHQLATGLAKRGFQVCICAPATGKSDWMPEWMRVPPAFLLNESAEDVVFYWLQKLLQNRFPVVSGLRALEPGRLRLYWRRIGKRLPEADVNVATWCFTTFAVVGLSRPFYYVQHFEPSFFSDRWLRDLALSTYRLPLRQIVVSQWLQRSLKERFGKDATCVGNGIDLAVFKPSPRRLFEEGSKKVICAFFRDTEWKGNAELLDAVHRVHKKRKDILLALVGRSDRLSEGLRKHSNLIDYPVLSLTNLSDHELAQVYSSSDAFVSASWYEGFGLPPLEAMACGTAVVMTDSLGSRDYAAHLKNAYVVPPRDSNALAQGIDRVLSEETLRTQLIKGGLETAQKFDFQRVVLRVEAVFTDRNEN